MAKDWKTVMTPKQGAWNIPAVALTELDAFIHAAETALAAAKNETTRTPSPGLIFHSDRGMQYCSKSLRELMRLRCPAVRQSMSRKGNCWDNACAESFFKTLKGELETLEGKHSAAEVRQSVFMYTQVR